MSCECYQLKSIAKTRKEHRCEFCGEIIPVGSPAHMESGKIDNWDGFFRRYCCDRCWPLTDEFWEYVDGECGDPISESFACFLMSENPEMYREIFGDDD